MGGRFLLHAQVSGNFICGFVKLLHDVSIL